MRTTLVPRLALALTLLACDAPTVPEPDAGQRSDGGGSDGGVTTPEVCVIDRECADDDWCDGDEVCFPGATDADARGCVEASAPRCGEGYDCEAEARECVTRCEVALDGDGDGRLAIACGGDDCDDADANRFPGNPEVCDASGHDEDCNPESIGSLDEDGDGSIARVCCNGAACGDDCNDRDSAVNPRVGDVCDGVDNDCSGAADEGCACRPGETRACGSAAALASTGTCRPGNQVCVMGELTAGCIGAIEPLEEICDGTARDEDCDGMIDEDVLRTYYRDADGDGYGTAGETIAACSAPDGWASNAFDCDDSLAPVNPGIPEICNDRDDDCDMSVDEGLLRAYYLDGDGDGFGASATTACSPPTAMHVERGGDCDDSRAGASPVGIESCNGEDDDCDGSTDEGVLRTYYRDEDGDGVGGTTASTGCEPPAGHVALGGDCADTDAARYPGRYDACNGVDDDCNGTVDPGCTCTDGATQGCGPAASVGRCVRGTQVCVGGRWGECGGAVMASTETCNGIDDDCDGSTDEGTTVTSCRGDADGDGYGAGATSTQCRDATRVSAGYCPPGFTTTAGDCNDANAVVRPMGTEVCNGADDDCDTTIDETVTAGGCYADADGDTYGIGAASTQCRDAARASVGYCPSGYANRGGDCNDAASGVRPDAAEACNGRDDNCDGATDEGTTVTSCRGDADGDGYGAGATSTQCRDATRMSAGYCPPGFTTTAGDCNDSNAVVRPMGTEVCNGADDDCDAAIDETVTVGGCYADADNDTYGVGAASTQCRDAARASVGYCPSGYANRGGDCNDAASGVRPGAAETCNGRDDDCSGTADDGAGMICALGTTRAGSGAYGSCASVPGTFACASCTAEVFTPSPPAETCDGLDNDCDGARDEAFACERNTTGHACVTTCGTVGTRSCSASCAFTGQACLGAEVCNGCDDDGDGAPDDTFACVAGATRSCTRSCGATTLTGTQRCLADCGGWSACTLPEVCNGCDDDGDGNADNGFFCARDSISYCTTGCGTAGQRVCNSTCTAHLSSSCYAAGESCNYCDDDGDGDFDDDRPLATDTDVITPDCGDYTLYSTSEGCGFPALSQVTELVDMAFNDAGAAWITDPPHLGWGTLRATFRMGLEKSSSAYLPADGWALVLADGGSGNLGAVGGGLGVPMTRTGIAIEWRFYRNDPGVDQRDTLTVRRLTGSGSGTILRAATDVPLAEDFGSGDVTLAQDLTVIYTPENPSTVPFEERLQVIAGTTTIATLTGPLDLNREFLPGSIIQIGVTAATGGRTFRGYISSELVLAGDPPPTYVEVHQTCDLD